MATQATGGGSTVSFGNTPQANTDIFSFAEDASNILILNVLANDLGGAAKTLFSLDDGMSSSASTKNYAPADLLVKDVAYSSDAAGMAATGDRSALGARIWIEADGTVHYDKGDINVQLQALATGQTLTDTFTYAIQLGNGTLSWATVTLQFNGANDSVFITSSPQSGSVVEDANATPDVSDSQSAAGTISFNDADLNDTHSASFAAASSNTTSLGTFSLDPVNEAPNAANGAVQWHYNLNNAAAQYLAAGQTVAESFVVTINDGHGSTATQTVTVTITGTNDIVSITSGVQSGAVVEDAPSTPSLSDSLATAGSISFNDVDLSDGHTATFVAGAGNTTALGTFSLDPVSEAANAANGSVQWHYALNSAAAQYLAEGQSVTESFVVTINDGHGSTATQTVTVTTTGTNDIVSITSGVQSGSVVEDAPATPDPSDSLTTAGTISFTDVDLSDGHTATFVAAPANTSALGTFSLDTVSEGANTASGSVQWHYNLNNAAAQYLAAGQSVVEHYAVTVSDGQGSTVTQDVAITIAGANDVVSVTSGVQAGTVVEDAPATPDPSDSLTAAGTVSFTDVDLSDGHTATFVVAPANTTALGTFSLGPVSEAANAANGSVQWHYNLDNVAAQHLAAGQSVTESFVVTVNDGHGSTATQTVTITLTGTNDTPVAVADTNSGLEDSTITGSVATNDSDVDDGATLTYAQTSAVAGLTINADGSYSFEASNAAYQHLAEGATQVVVANYTVTDEHGASAPSTLTITLTGTNDTPVAVADTNSGLEDSTITGSVATNDSDVDDGATLTYAQTSAVAGLTINADGSYSFEASNAAYQHLAEGATQVVVANYTVTDEHGASAPSTLTITLTGTNDTPVAVADTNSGLEDSTITGSVATNDSDVDDGATLTYAQTSAVAGLTINADGSYSFEASNAAYQHLAEGATQVVVANYTVTDEHGASAPSTLTITLTGTNDTPVAVADTNSGLEDSTITGSVATNDSDVDDGATLTYAQTSAVAGLTINADGSYSFEASNAAYQHLAEGATQVVVANYTVTDEHGASAPSTLTITLTGTNDTPVAVADTNSGLEDSTITGSVATNDSDVDDGATLTYAQTSAVAGLTINADGSYSFEASNAAYQHLAEGATQVVVANYTVTDEHGASAPSTLTITLTGTNDTPVAVADTNSGLEDSTITGSVATNDSDVDDGATLTYAQTSAVAGLTINADGSYSFEASNAAYQHLAEGATQVVVANYTVTDEHGASAPSTLTITLTGTNDTPVAVADTNSGLEDSTITGSVATNDSDVDDGATLTYAQTSAVAGLTINADGSYSFEASNAAYQHLAEGATQVVVANYTVTDEHGASAPSTLTITLTGTNDTPVAVADTNSGLEDSTITGSVATNDSDVDDGATLTYAQTSAVAGLTINADGSYSFEASNAAYQHLAEGATQVVVANYTVTDEHGASAPSTLTITLTGTNDTPVAVADTNSGLEDSTITGSVATNDSDVDDGATLTYAQTSAVAGLTINADGSYSFEASNAAYQHLAEGATQVVVANYTVTDEHGASAPSTLTITLTGTNDTPVAVADTNSGLEDSTITGSVATNDSDVDDGATLTYAQTSAVAGLTINADGSYSFEASNAAYQHLAEGATQVVVANYTVTDEHGASAPSTLTITLTGTNDTPVAVADTNSGLEDSTITGSVATNDSDVDDGATLTYAQTSAVAGLTINADGSYSFEASNAAYQHLAEGATQVVVANYTVTDEHGASAPSTLTITLTGTNDTPVAVADTNSGLEDSTITGSVATNDSDVDDGATLTYAQTSAVAGLTINADGSYSFEASNAAYQHLAEGATQVVVANYTVTDEHGASAPSTLTITLTGTNDTPVAVADTNSGLEDSTITGSVATNDSDVDDGATLTYAQTSAVAGLTINADGSYSFEASNAAYQHLAEGATQVVVANYTVTDEHGASAPSTLTITLTGTNDTPVAVADTNSGLEDSTITGSVATNDSDVDDGATLTYAQTSAVAGLTINADGSYSFEASNAAYQHLAEGATQVVVANYTVTDEHGASAPSTLTITLTGTNDTPVAVADTNSGLEDSTITGSVATNDSDVDDGATLTYAQTSAVAGLTINADGSYSFEASNAAYQHLAEGATQVVVANYTVTDEHGASAPSTLTITLTGTNDTPVAVADTNSGLEDSTITGSVATNDSDVDDGATLTYAQTSAVAGLTINADGSYSFEASNAAYQHLAEGATQVVVANYTVTDEHGASAPSTLTITLTGTNDTPVAVADTNSGLEDSTITGSVATNDSDVDDGATLTYAQTSAVAGLTINADGSYSFEASNAAYQHLAEGATQVVVANYTVTDEHGASAPSTLTITLTGTNDTPVAVADTNSGLEDSTITGSVATNDSDVDDGATLTYAQTSAVAGLTINADGSYSFEASNAAYQHLAEGATQVVVANYTVTDEHGASAPSTLTITLTGTNDTPVAVADTNSGLEDSTITGSVATNDSDVDDGATLTYAQTSAVAGLTINADGSYSFEASNAAYQHLAEGATQVVVANYTVTDEHGASAPSTLTITLTGTNDTPVAVADTNSGLEDSTITGSVATNDSDVDDGATLTYAQTSAVAGLTINADGSYSFEASNAAYQHLAEGATQVVVANYTVTDEHGASAPSTLTITLTGTNDTPVAVADTNSGLEDSTITGSVATNDSDVDDGATLTYAQTSAVAGLTINADGSYSFEASNAAYQHLAEGATQVVVANYTVTDEHGASAPSTLTITLTGTNDTPVAVADTNSGLEDSTITGSVATNDSDVDDGATLTYAQTSAVAGLTINADGSYSFEASNAAYQHLAEGATQVVVANYTVTDEHGASAPSTLTITLTGTNDTPVAVADTNSGLEDSTITGSVATNDSDVDDGATLTYAQTSAVAGLTINADGSYSFEASNAAYQHLAEGATQVVVANYTVTDEHGASAPSTLTITLTGTNDTPVAVADTNSGLEDSTITGSVATNDSDVDDGATLTYAQTSAVAGLTINADGSYSFEASNAAYQHLAEGATQVVVANYTVTDEHGASAPSTLTITLTGTNDTPVAVADTNSGLEDSTITGSVATNDSDVDDGATLTYAQTSAVAGLTINADGSYSFEASNAAYQHLAEGATQVVVANYTVTDEHGASAPSTLTITLTGTNDTPVAVADTNSGLEDSTITGSVATNDSDVDDGATLTYAQTSAVAGLTINADGSYSFEASNAAYQHLAEGATQVVVANYTVTDEHGASAPSTLTITLTGTNDTPVAVADTNSGLEDSTITGSVATNDSDVDDGATLTYAQTSAVAGLTINADGSYSFEASNAAYQHLAEGATQVVVANYTVTDEHGASAPSTLTITLTGTNDTPVAVADTNSGLEDSTITGSVATNDSDVDDGATLTYAQTSAVAGLTINADGSYSFEASNAAYQHLAEGATQVVVANYTVTDEHGASAPSTLTITLTGTNDTPVAVADTNSGLEDSTITGSVATNDSDVDDGATLTYAQTSAVAGLTINADGSYSFEASNAAYQHLAEGATQVVVANYTVTDEHGASAPSTLTITLTGTNDTPVAVADTNSGLEDSTITGSVATNDSDVDDGATLTYAQTSAVAGLTINADGSYSFEASNAAYQHLAEGATQVVVANYTVTDEHGASAPSTLTITLTGTNDTPVAVADTNSGLEDSTITGSVATNDSDVDDGATLTYAQTSAVAGLTINADGSYSFEASNAAYQHLAEGATQVVVANYTVTDEHGASAPSTLTITLTGTNDTPVAVADTNSGLEDSTITGSVATNDSDVDDGATLTYAQTSAVAGLTINADGSYSFEASNAAYQHLAEGATQVVVANYTVTDEHGASAPSTLTITLTGTNDTPVAVADTNSGLEDSTITGSVATNDSDVDDGATLTYAQTSAVAGLTINADGSYSFEASNAAYQHLAEGATQVVVANYTVTDEHGASAPSTLTITLTGTNDTPVAVADTNSGLEDSTITGSVATNDSDVDDGATLTYAQTSAVAGLTINADGSYSFEASNAAYQHLAEGATQVVVANYTVTDEHGASAPSTLTITLTGTNDTPVAVADTNSGLEDSTITGSVATNDSDVDDGATLTYAQTSAVAGLTINADGSYSFEASNAAYQHLAEGATQVVVANYTVTDEHGASAPSTLTITLTGTNDTPVAVADTNSGLEDSTITGSVATNDSDVDDGATLTYAQTSAVAGLTINADGSYSFEASNAAYQHLAEGATQVVVANYTVTDEHGASAPSTLTITLTGTNDTPVAVADTNSGLEDSTITGSVATNDSDVDDGATLTYAQTSAVAGLTINADGSYSFEASNAAYQHLAEGATQVVVANYTVTDEHGASAPSTLTITLTGTNDTPVAVADTNSGLEDSTITGSVATNDSDVDDGATLTYAQTSAVAGLTINADGSYSFEASNAAYQHLAEGATQVVVANYTVTDEHGASAPSTLTITLTGTNDTPVAVADTNSGLEDSTITGSVATNDSDVDDGATLTYAQTSAVAGLTINADGSYSFEASNAAYQHLAEGATQVVVANYTVTDEHGASAPSTLTITLTGTNDTPVAVADTNSGLEDSTITGSVATNDSDVDDGATLTYAQTSAVAGLTINADGSYSFEASNAAYQHLAEGATQVVVANYTVTDEHGASAPSTLTITLTGTNDTPVAVADTNSGLEDSTITGSVATNDSDVDDGATLTYAQTSAVAGLTINADGSYSFEASNAAYQHLAEGATQVVVANYTVTDEHGASAPSTLTITLTGTNDTPVAVADTNSGLEDSTITGSVATNDSDVDDGATLTYAQTSAVAGLTINADGSYSFEASNAAYQHLAEGATQVVVANYTVTDEHGASAPSTLTITLTGTNDTPVAVADTNSGLEDSTITGSVATNDSDVDDGATLTYAQTSAVAGLTINADGSYSFEASNAAYQHLAEGATQVVVANYTVTDEHGASAPSTLTITLTGTNDTPVAVADTNSGLEDSTITGSVATNDSDVDDGATLTYAQTSAVAGLTINADGSYSFEASNAAYQHLAEGATQVVVANYTVTDEHGASAPSTLTITLTGTNDTPVAVADTNSGLEDSTITGSVATNDSDVDDGATLTYAQTSAVAGLTINADGSYSFEASNAAYQHLAEGATQVVVANYTVTDEHGASAPSTLTITLTGTNDTPVAVAGHTLNYTENHAATAIDPALTVSDVDNANLVSATVQITGNYVNGQDVLGFTNQNGITGSFNAATGMLTLTGSSSVANYQTALDSVTYFNTSDNPSGLARTVTIITNDGAANSVAVTDMINVTPVNDAPALATTSTLAYTENQAATAINTALTVTDADNPTLTSGTVSITANFVSGQDILAFTNVPATMGNIAGSYNGATGVMTLTSAGGTATLAQWQAAERAVTYANSSDNPSTLARTVTYTVDDGQGVNHASNGLTSTINITAVNDAPALATTSALAYTENQAATAINTALTVTDADNPTLTSGTVSITANFVSGQDILAFTNVPATMGNIAGSYNGATGVMTLTSAGGTATLAQWQAAERAVTYANSSDNPSTLARTVTYTVDDGQGVNHASNGLTSTINITAVNDAPALATTSALAYTENQAATAINTALTVTDADNPTLTSGTVSITANFVSGQDILAFTNVPATMGNIAGSYNGATGVMTLTSAGGTATLAQWQAAERAVTYANSSDNPSTLARTVTYTVDDGQGVNHASNGLTSTINITAVNDAPVNTVPATSVNAGNGSGTATFSGASLISISDVDAGSGSVTVSLSLGASAQSLTGILTLATTTGLTFNAGANATKAMTFTGTITDINNALNGMVFSNGSNNSTRTLTITTNDNGNSGSGGSHTDVDTVSVVKGNGSTPITPAGTAGEAINLALPDQSLDHLVAVTANISGIPSGWILSEGAVNSDGSWTVVTNDIASLAITSPSNYTGALVLNVTETWTNTDGSTGSAIAIDNVEAYAPGSPIFALSGDDNLTGSSGHDMFVFSQPIGHDVIYSFDATSDRIDLIGYANFTGFGDIQAHMANDAAGNAVITLADGQSITLNGVDASSLTASDFVFDQTPVTENAGHMVISDGAILPLSGVIDNTGTMELNSTGDETDLQLIEHGITLQGGGHVDLSDSSENVITGTVSDVTLTNVDNTISGAGHLGDGVMVLVNEGTIIATGTNALDIDTGANAVTNPGTLEATGTGGLEVHSDLINTGVLWANGGNVTIDGNVSGNGTAQISGSATLEFGAASSANVALDAQATGTIVLHDSFDFSGVVSGFNGDDHLDLLDVAFGAGTTASYVANQAGAGGTLSVTDGVHTANITLLGQYDPAGFQTEADKNTGTLISYHDHLA